RRRHQGREDREEVTLGGRAIACALAAGLLVSSCATREDPVPSAGGFALSSPAGPESPPTSSAGPEPSAEPSASASSEAGPVKLRARPTPAGEIVVDDQGLTLYAFDKDKGDFESNCTGACAKDWPPVLTDGQVTVGPGINTALASTITRPDGT